MTEKKTPEKTPEELAIEANCKLFDSHSKPPSDALRQIKGGRLSGKTDINPQWRYRALTEMFGPCGTGWWYTIESTYTEQVGDEIAAFAVVHLFYKGCTSPIIGHGGSMLREQERGGLHCSDEAFKMAITDALSVCCKMLGIASAIYAGKWDGSKYSDEAPGTEQRPATPVVRQGGESHSPLQHSENDRMRDKIGALCQELFDAGYQAPDCDEPHTKPEDILQALTANPPNWGGWRTFGKIKHDQLEKIGKHIRKVRNAYVEAELAKVNQAPDDDNLNMGTSEPADTDGPDCLF